MTAIVKTINLKECPKLASWIEDEEGFLCNYLRDIQRVIPSLLAAQANLDGSDPSDDFKAIGHAARVLGCIANDMDIIRKELFP